MKQPGVRFLAPRAIIMAVLAAGHNVLTELRDCGAVGVCFETDGLDGEWCIHELHSCARGELCFSSSCPLFSSSLSISSSSTVLRRDSVAGELSGASSEPSFSSSSLA